MRTELDPRAIPLTRIVAGGQTGVDRAGLDVAIELGIEHGGWCPHGRRAEDGRIPDRYRLRETDTAHYPTRTRRNVVDSDGTLVLTRGAASGGTKLTIRIAHELDKPLHVVDLNTVSAVEPTLAWLRTTRIETLNIAGPRESGAPGIAAQATVFLRELLAKRV